MTTEERLAKIEEKHLALTESIELMHHDMQQWIEHSHEQDAKYEEMRRSIVRGIVAYLTPAEDSNGSQNA